LKIHFNIILPSTPRSAKLPPSISGICENVQHCAQHSYNVTANSYNSQLTLHTDSHSGAVRQEFRTILGAKSKILYSEIALSWKPFGIGQMYIHTFLLRMTDAMTSHNTDNSSWDTLYAIQDIKQSNRYLNFLLTDTNI
jgi:hypothetical protein